MRETAAGQEARSLGTIVRDLSDDLRTLLRAEIALAKLELKASFMGLGGAAAMFGVAAFLALIAAVLLIVTLILVLGLWMPHWLATLLVALLVLGVAGALVYLGKKRLSRTHLAPTDTINSVRGDIEAVRSGVRRN